MEILSFGIDCAPRGKNPQGYAVDLPINLQPPTPRHDHEQLSTIVNTAPRAPSSVHDPLETCSRSRGIPFTIPWKLRSRSRGIRIGTFASLDASGRLVVYATAMQKIGLAAGPALAGFLLEPDGYQRPLLLATSLMVLSFALVYPASRRR